MKIIEPHTNYENKDLSQWNCMNFDFQANRRDNLKEILTLNLQKGKI